MIFVTVGTQKHRFSRMFDYIHNYNFNDDVVIQCGYNHVSNRYEHFNFKPDLSPYFKECDIVITHGGVGSIIEGLQNNKKVLVIPRMKAYKEHVNDHQFEICNKLAKGNYVMMAKNEEEFIKCMNTIKEHQFNKFDSNTEHFNLCLNNKIEELMR